VRYESLSGHRKYATNLPACECKECKQWAVFAHNHGPCADCTDEKLCPIGERAKRSDEFPRGWATYHLDRCYAPEEVLEEATTHKCMRCEHPEWYTDGKPCTTAAELHAIHARCLDVIARVKVEPELGRRLINVKYT